MRPLFEQYPGLEELQVFTTQKRMKVEFRHEDHANMNCKSIVLVVVALQISSA